MFTPLHHHNQTIEFLPAFSTRLGRLANPSLNIALRLSFLQKEESPPRQLTGIIAPFTLEELSDQDPKKTRASQKYRGIPIAILNGNVMPKEAVRYSEGLASGKEMRIAAGAAI